MRTGAIFARGSCRALKWMALFGVVYALGVGEAAAQPSLTVKTSSTVPEGANRVPVTVQLKAPAETGGGATRSETVTVTLTLTPRPDGTTGLPADRGKNAELGTGQDASWAEGETGQTVDAAAGTVAIAFSVVGNAAYDRTERAYLNIGSDTDAEDEELVITSTSTSTETADDAITPSGKDVKVKIVDAQTQTYTLAPTNFGTKNAIDEGGNIPLTLTADPAKTVDVAFRVTLDSADDSDYGLDSANSTSEDITVLGNVDDDGTAVTTGVGIATVTLFSQANDGDREDDTVTLMTAYTEGDKRGKPAAEDLEILVRDQHKLPKVSRDEDIEVEDDEGEKSDVTMLYEGQTGTVTLMVDRTGDGVRDSEDITVELSLGMGSTATRQDYRLNPDEVEIEGSGETGTFELEALMDEDVSADGETLVLMATVSGDEDFGPNPDDPVMLDAITINDRTAKKIWPRSKDEAEAAIDEARAEGARRQRSLEPRRDDDPHGRGSVRLAGDDHKRRARERHQRGPADRYRRHLQRHPDDYRGVRRDDRDQRHRDGDFRVVELHGLTDCLQCGQCQVLSQRRCSHDHRKLPGGRGCGSDRGYNRRGWRSLLELG